MEDIQFQFSYLALKLLGKNLYSNAWAALSELVANSLDAQANNVKLYINMVNKNEAIIEIYDDGKGMNYNQLKNDYARIGRNRRNEPDAEFSDTVMGRKGIGKLAALYLSNHYYVITKKEKEDFETFEMLFESSKEDEINENPKMKNVINKIEICNEEFYSYNRGTMIRMENVKLSGYGEVSLDSLKKILSDFFAVDNIKDQNIFIKIVENQKDEIKPFEQIAKSIPYKNLVAAISFDEGTTEMLSQKLKNNEFELPYSKKKGSYVKKTEIIEAPNSTFRYDINVKDENGKDITELKIGEITGWIGIHSSIENKIAQKNDIEFNKSKLYNPLKLRVYVRNKLAIEDFLPIINNTQAFINYVEGEINFNILDDNDFPDIATTNRQSMDEKDRRIEDLAQTVKTSVNSLIAKRNNISKTMKAIENEHILATNTTAKSEFSKEVDEIFSKANIDSELSEEIKSKIVKQVKGENVKNNYMIFFSHARADKKIMDFFYYILRKKGINESELFYTSREDKNEIPLKQSLEEISKKNITDTNTAMVFYSTDNFRKSEFCMFEGGAAWATRSKDDFFISFDNYASIPAYLSTGEEFIFEIKEDTNILSGDNYNKLVQFLNFMIRHINIGRRINQEVLIEEYKEEKFPDLVDQNNGILPNLNKEIIDYWSFYLKDVRSEVNKSYQLV